MLLDHVQIAAPPGCEAEARRFFGGLLGWRRSRSPSRCAGAEVTWGNRIELLAY